MLTRPDVLSFSKTLPFFELPIIKLDLEPPIIKLELELPIITPDVMGDGSARSISSGRGGFSSMANSRSLFAPGGNTGGSCHQSDELNSLFVIVI